MFKNLPRSIYILFISRIIIALGYFVYPFLTLYLTQKLHYSQEVAARFLSIVIFGTVIGATCGSYLADRFGRKKVLLYSAILTSVCNVTVAYCPNPNVILILLFLSQTFYLASEPAFNALLADLSGKKYLKESFSLIYLGINIGWSIGPLIASYLFDHYIKLLFIGDAAALLISALLIFIFIKEEEMPSDNMTTETVRTQKTSMINKQPIISFLVEKPIILFFCFFYIISPLIYSQIYVSLPLFVSEIFKDRGITFYGNMMAANGIAVIIFTPLITKLTKKIRPLLCIAIGGILFAVGFGIYYFIENYWLFLLSVIIWTCGEILSITNAKVYIAQNSKIHFRAQLNALLEIANEIGFAAGPLLISFMLAQSFSVKIVWPVIFAMALVSAIAMIIMSFIDHKNVRMIHEGSRINQDR